MKRIKIAQIGTSTNSHGNDIFNTLKKLDDIFEIIGVVFPENEREKFPERMEDFGGYNELTLDDALDNPEIEAVIIETEEIYLTKYALMAAKAGKHIHMEKPGGLLLSDFTKLIDTVKKNKIVFHIGYMYRYNPYICELKNQITNGELGEIISIEAQMNCIQPKKVREWLNNFPSGIMFFLGCHLIDLVYSIQGKPEKIIPLNRCSNFEGVTSKDFGMIVFEYENGNSFVKTSAVEVGGFERRQLVVSGTKRTVEIKPLEWYVEPGRLVTSRSTYSSIDWNTAGTKEQSDPTDRYELMMRSFAEMVRGEKENPWDYDYELELYKIILEACGI